jgi:hypothetical protein
MSVGGDIEGIDIMRSAIERLIANNFVVRVPLYLAMLAEASIHHNQFALARDSLSAAFERADRQEEYWSQPELLRVRGLLRWLDGDLPGASETLSLAMETARESGASFFQLRATTALADLWAQTDRHEPAAELLSPICSSFDDISPCMNMMKASHLLETLRRRASGTN